MTQAEMLLGVALLPAGRRRDTLEVKVAVLFAQHFANRCLPFDAQAAPHYARIVASRQKAGKRIATEDAQIAAIAGLEIVNPWDVA